MQLYFNVSVGTSVNNIAP